MTTRTRQVAEDMRFAVEIRRMIEESDKFRAEQRKLMAEAAKLDRDRWFAPIVVMSSAAAAFGSVFVGLLIHFLK